MRNINKKLLDAVDGSTTQNSAALQVGNLGGAILFTVQAQATASASGTLKLQYSVDVPTGSSSFTPTNWSDVTSSSASVSVGSAYAFQSALASPMWLRASYTGSGAGALTVAINVIGVTH